MVALVMGLLFLGNCIMLWTTGRVGWTTEIAGSDSNKQVETEEEGLTMLSGCSEEVVEELV